MKLYTPVVIAIRDGSSVVIISVSRTVDVSFAVSVVGGAGTAARVKARILK